MPTQTKPILNGRYLVSSDGYLINTSTKKKVFGGNVKGYKFFKCQEFRSYVHRIVAELFIPNPLNLPEVNHKNTNKQDNRAVNLEWTDHQDNVAHSKNLIESYQRKRKDRWPLNEAIEAIKLNLVYGLSRKEIGSLFGRSYGSVRKVLSQEHLYKHALSL